MSYFFAIQANLGSHELISTITPQSSIAFVPHGVAAAEQPTCRSFVPQSDAPSCTSLAVFTDFDDYKPAPVIKRPQRILRCAAQCLPAVGFDAQLPVVDLKSTPLTSRANWRRGLPAGGQVKGATRAIQKAWARKVCRAVATAAERRGGKGHELFNGVVSAFRHPQSARPEGEGREIRTPNLLIWSQTRCRCAIPPVLNKSSSKVVSCRAPRSGRLGLLARAQSSTTKL